MPIMARLVMIKNKPSQCQILLADSPSANVIHRPIAAATSGGTHPNMIARRLGLSQVSRIKRFPSNYGCDVEAVFLARIGLRRMNVIQDRPTGLQKNCSRSTILWRRFNQ
jgi:hypothetical protein